MRQTAFILLSAGESSRMGQDKALLDFFTQPWVFEQARQIKASDVVEELMVVTKPEKMQILENILQPLKDTDFQIHVTVNAEPNSKSSDSLACALRAHQFPDGAFVSPIDVPQSSEILKTIWKSVNKKHIVKPMLGNRGGHPVWLQAQVLDKFQAGHRLDQFIHSYESKHILELAIDNPWIVMNLNTLSEWENFKTTTR